MFVFPGIRSQFLLQRQLHLQFQLQQLAQARTRITNVLDRLYYNANPDPNAPANTGPNQQFIARLQAWDVRITLTQTRLQQELQYVNAEKEGQQKRFQEGVKQFYDMMA